MFGTLHLWYVCFLLNQKKAIVDLVLVVAPTTIFNLKIQVDTGLDVARNDYPRMAVLALGWFEIMGYYFEAFLPFVPDAFLPNEVKKFILIGKHLAINAMNAVKNNILIGFNVVGMLSSSFQPNHS